METPKIQQVFTVEGCDKQFSSKAEVMDHLRRPKILDALKELTNGDAELAKWLLDHDELIKNSFDVGTIKRVTKSDRKKLDKALEAIKEAKNPAFAFVADNVEAIAESFRWPSVKRMDDEEKTKVAVDSIAAAAEGNREVAEWIVSNKDKILEAYKAGKPKRQPPQKALDALAAYREQKAAEKAAKEAEKAETAAE